MAKIDRSKLPETGFIRLPQVLSIYPVSKSTWWEGIRVGKYPQGVKLSGRVTAWRVQDIRRLIEERGTGGGSTRGTIENLKRREDD